MNEGRRERKEEGKSKKGRKYTENERKHDKKMKTREIEGVNNR